MERFVLKSLRQNLILFNFELVKFDPIFPQNDIFWHTFKIKFSTIWGKEGGKKLFGLVFL